MRSDSRPNRVDDTLRQLSPRGVHLKCGHSSVDLSSSIFVSLAHTNRAWHHWTSAQVRTRCCAFEMRHKLNAYFLKFELRPTINHQQLGQLLPLQCALDHASLNPRSVSSDHPDHGYPPGNPRSIREDTVPAMSGLQPQVSAEGDGHPRSLLEIVSLLQAHFRFVHSNSQQNPRISFGQPRWYPFLSYSFCCVVR